MTTPPKSQPRAPRADVRRNVAAILAAGEELLARDPEATMSAIASAAGVGRVTLYAHFPSRAELVEAVFRRVVTEAAESLDAIDVSGDAADALARLVGSGWQVVHRFRSILAAAERELSPEVIRDLHDPHLARLAALLERGRAEGRLRSDLPLDWLATTCFTLMHAAAAEVVAGRLTAADAEHAVVSTILAVCVDPAR